MTTLFGAEHFKNGLEDMLKDFIGERIASIKEGIDKSQTHYVLLKTESGKMLKIEMNEFWDDDDFIDASFDFYSSIDPWE